MIPHSLLSVIVSLAVLPALPGSLNAQAPGVRIVRDDRSSQSAETVRKANAACEKGQSLDETTVRQQLERTHCELKLPKRSTRRLTSRQIWERAQAAYVRVGWHYLCNRCDEWHQTFAGGYFVTADGVVATCHHVIEPGADRREAHLLAASELGEIWPVTEVLAANARTDVALLRVATGRKMRPLALNTDVYPGDSAWCFSDPLGRSSYFSHGIVNRFCELRREGEWAPRMDVSTDWAPGSSGSAVLDQHANAIGHVSEINAAGRQRHRGTNQPANALITFHYAARAADVLALTRPPLSLPPNANARSAPGGNTDSEQSREPITR